jgi:4-amino-4-deoxy-L-arabinose transferase-like glycosyltransferase
VNKTRHLNWIVVVLCLVSFARGVHDLGKQSLWWDESLSHYRATQPFGSILANRMAFLNGTGQIPVTPDNHPPLYFVLLRLLVLAAGDSEFAMRFLSVLAGVALVPLLYQCGRRLFDVPRDALGTSSAPGIAPAGTMAALLGAISPLYLWAQQEARPYALGTTLAALSLYALMRLLPAPAADSGAQRRGQKTGWDLVYACSTLALLATHYHGTLLLLPQGLIALVARARHKGRLLAGLLVAGLAAGGALVWVLRVVMPPVDLPGYTFVPLGVLLQDVFRSFPLGISGDTLGVFPWVSAGLLLAALGILIVRRRRASWQYAAYAALCCLLPIAEIYAVSFVRPAYMNIRHLIFASPFYYILLGAGVAEARQVHVRVPVHLALGALLVGMLLSTHVYRTQFAKEDHRGWGRYLSEHVRPGDLVLVNPGAIGELYFYYVQSQAPYYGFPLLDAGKEDTLDLLQQLAEENDRVWVAQSLTPYWANPGNLALKWLRQHATQIAFADFDSANTVVQADAFRLHPPVIAALPEAAAPLALDFEERLRLLGWDSTADQAVSGHTLQLSLYWSAPQALDQEYRIALSLGDDEGYAWAARDYAPCAGTFATVQWPAGAIVRDDVDLDLPPGIPPGRYRLNVMVYPARRDGPALAVRDVGSDALRGLIVPVAEIQVVSPEKPPTDDEIPVAYRTARRYGDLALLGHNYHGGTAQPGDILLVDAYWRVLRRPQGELPFRLELVDEGGTVRASRAIVATGRYRPEEWRKGDVVRGQYRFRVPIDVPPGTYTLCLAPGEERLGGLWPWGRRVTLNTLTVEPAAEGRTFEVPPIQHPLRANLGDQVELLGYDLASPAIQPGQVVSCTLYWRALQGMDQNYTVFNHLVDPGGQAWGQWDNQPARGQMPTTRWVPGQVIADPYQIPVSADAPAGTLELQVGMYDRLTMKRLPVYGEQGDPVGDAVTVAEIEVVRP